MDSETKIEFLKRHKDKAVAEQAKIIESFDVEIRQIEASIAETEKPELRHGDYGPAKGSEGRLVLKEFGKDDLRSAGPACCAAIDADNQMPDIVLGNIFRDLEEMAEDVEEFEITDFNDNPIKCEFHKGTNNDIAIEMIVPSKVTNLYLSMEVLSILIRKLQAMYATHMRKQNAV